MKRVSYSTISCLISALLAGCSHPANKAEIKHIGAKTLTHTIESIDTVSIKDDYLSGRYNTFLLDSHIVFADQMQNTLSFYNIDDGALACRRLGYGSGPNELTSMLYAQPIQGSDGEIAIFDSSYGLFIYTFENDSLKYKGIPDFNWGKGKLNDYNEIANYTPMEMSDFAISFAKRDSTLLMPLSIIGRNFDKCDENRYREGGIFCNVSGMKASKPFGEFPALFSSQPMPNYEFFDFAVNYTSDEIIYNFAPDSLIYISDAEGNPIRTFGFEPSGINRNYTIGYDTNIDTFKNDTQKVGVNTGLYLDSENELIFRTSLKDFSSGIVILQAYDYDGNLIMESLMPDYFKLLGQYDGFYYGTRFIPEEVQGDDLSYPIYRFKIQPVSFETGSKNIQ